MSFPESHQSETPSGSLRQNGPSADRIDEDRLDKVLADFELHLERDQSTDRSKLDRLRQELISNHPAIAEDLRSYFEDYDAVEQALRDSGCRTEVSQRGGSSLPRGTLIGASREYEVLSLIGRGGMAEVYLAKQLTLDRTVAVKILRVTYRDDPVIRERFVREPRLIARLDHPHIVKVIDVQEYDGIPYFSMEHCPGGNLKQRIASAPLSQGDVANYMNRIASAVQYAHERGILHRDLKPANVLIDRTGEPLVADFGLAKPLISDGTLTDFGQTPGTLAYMAPEQLDNARGDVSTRTDVYALGVTLFELLTSTLPFQANKLPQMHQLILNQQPRFPSLPQSVVDVDMRTITLKCLEKSPEDRYESSGQLAADLQRYLNGQPILARPVGAMVRAMKWCRRNSIVASLIAISVLLLCGGTAVSVWQARRAHDSEQRSSKNALLATKWANDYRSERDQARQSARTLEATSREMRQLATEKGQLADSERRARKLASSRGSALQRQLSENDNILYRMQIAATNRELQAADILTAKQSLKQTRWDMRGWEYNYLYARLNPVEKVGPRTSQEIHGRKYAAASFDYCTTTGYGACGSNDGTLRILDFQTNRSVQEFQPHQGRIARPIFSRSGTHIVTGYRNSKSNRIEIKLWDVGADNTDAILVRDAGHVEALAVSDDGATVAFEGEDHSIVLWNADAGESVFRLEGHKCRIGSLAFSPDGGQLVSGDVEGTLWAWNISDRTTLWTNHLEAEEISKLCFAVDGQSFAVVRSTPSITLIDASSGALTRRFIGFQRAVKSIAFNSAGTRLIGADEAGKFIEWEIANGLITRGWVGTQYHSRCIGYLPKQQTVIGCGSFGSRTYRTSSTSDVVETNHSARSEGPFAISPNQRWMAVPMDDGTIRIWDLLEKRQVCQLIGHTAAVTSVEFHPNSQRLLSASMDRSIRVWNQKTGEELQKIPVRGSGVLCAVYSKDGERVAGSSDSSIVQIWNSSTGKYQQSCWNSLSENCITFSPDGELIVATRPGGTIDMFDTGTGKRRLTFLKRSAIPSCLAFSPDGLRIAGTTRGVSGVTLWNIRSGQPELGLQIPQDSVRSLTFSPDGTRVVTGSIDGSVRIWDAKTGNEMLTLPGHESPVAHVDYVADRSQLTSIGEDCRIRHWGTKIASAALEFTGFSGEICAVAIDNSGKYVAGRDWNGKLIVWNTNTGRADVGRKWGGSFVGIPCGLAFSPDGSLLVGEGIRETIEVLETTTGEIRRIFSAKSHRPFSFAFSPDAKRIVSGGEVGVKVWDTTSGKELLSFGRTDGGYYAVAFSPDGKHILVGGGIDLGDDSPTCPPILTLYNASTGEEVRSFSGHQDLIYDLAFGPDGLRFASADYSGETKLWDIEQGTNLWTQRTQPGSVTFSPDGTKVIGTARLALRVWDAATGRELSTIPCSINEHNLFALQGDGSHVAVVGRDKITLLPTPSLKKRPVNESDKLKTTPTP